MRPLMRPELQRVGGTGGERSHSFAVRLFSGHSNAVEAAGRVLTILIRRSAYWIRIHFRKPLKINRAGASPQWQSGVVGRLSPRVRPGSAKADFRKPQNEFTQFDNEANPNAHLQKHRFRLRSNRE